MRLFIILALCFSLAGCKSPKTATTDTHQKQLRNIENDLKVSRDSAVYETIARAIQTAINERLNISLKQTKYDTDKPIDPETGKPPIKEENDINLSKETETQIAENASETKASVSSIETIDKGKDKTKIEGKEKTKTETGLSKWQNFFICFGGLSLTCLIGFLFFKFK